MQTPTVWSSYNSGESVFLSKRSNTEISYAYYRRVEIGRGEFKRWRKVYETGKLGFSENARAPHAARARRKTEDCLAGYRRGSAANGDRERTGFLDPTRIRNALKPDENSPRPARVRTYIYTAGDD